VEKSALKARSFNQGLMHMETACDFDVIIQLSQSRGYPYALFFVLERTNLTIFCCTFVWLHLGKLKEGEEKSTNKKDYGANILGSIFKFLEKSQSQYFGVFFAASSVVKL